MELVQDRVEPQSASQEGKQNELRAHATTQPH